MTETPLCLCGCGLPVPLATQTNTRLGLVKGQPTRYRRWHHAPRVITERDYAVEDRGYETPCWIWNGNTTPDGYPIVGMGGRKAIVHRHMYEREVGPIPDGHHLHHRCAVERCIRPEHCEPLDRTSHRRLHSKLTPEVVEQIRADAGTQRVVAARFGVTKSTVGRIRRGDAWS